MIVKYMQLCAFFSPFALLRKGKRYEVMPEIKRNVRFYSSIKNYILLEREREREFDREKKERKLW